MTELAPGARITGEARASLTEKVVARYLAGESIRAVATDLGRSYGFIQKLLVEAEVPLRRRGGDTRSQAARERLIESQRQLIASAAGASRKSASKKGKGGKGKKKTKKAKKSRDGKGKKKS